ncbi:precorrin-4 C(11)-methyltransferase, partial [Streptomyces toxytricini]
VKEAGLVRTSVIIVGRTLGAEQFRDSHLYSPERDRHVC